MWFNMFIEPFQAWSSCVYSYSQIRELSETPRTVRIRFGILKPILIFKTIYLVDFKFMFSFNLPTKWTYIWRYSNFNLTCFDITMSSSGTTYQDKKHYSTMNYVYWIQNLLQTLQVISVYVYKVYEYNTCILSM